MNRVKEKSTGKYFEFLDDAYIIKLTENPLESAEFPTTVLEEAILQLKSINPNYDWEVEVLPQIRTSVTAHRGFVCIIGTPDAEGMINDPLAPGENAYMVDASCVDVSPEALELLKKLKNDSDVDIICLKRDDGVTVFGWKGQHYAAINNVHKSSTDNDFSLLSIKEGLIVDEGFVKFVNDNWEDVKHLVIS